MELDELRTAVRRIDADMAALFEKRMSLVRQIGAYKVNHDLPVYDAQREEENIRMLVSLLSDLADRPYFVRWYKTLMTVCREAEKKIPSGRTRHG